MPSSAASAFAALLVVAGQDLDVADPQRPQLRQRGRHFGAPRVGRGQDARKLAVERHEEQRLALGFQRSGET